jgi:hypothetical protein
MRAITLAFATATVLAVGVSDPALAANLPTDAQCHALARQRAGSEVYGRRTHESFIRQCMAGKIPFAAEVVTAPPAFVGKLPTDAQCHALARQRAGSEVYGRRTHESFIRQCMAGKIPFAAEVVTAPPAFVGKLPTDAQCHALARQRGGSEVYGRRTHESFIRQCVAGKIPFAQ